MQVYNDELYHYGKIGMKWGKRAAGIKEAIGVRSQAQKNMIIHPIHTTKSQVSMVKNNPRLVTRFGTQAYKDLNADVAKRVADSKKTKKSVKDHIAAGAKHVGPVLKVLGSNAAKAHAE